jgi:hypothetical protein
MGDVLVYWRDYAANWPYRQMGERAFFLRKNARLIARPPPAEQRICRGQA